MYTDRVIYCYKCEQEKLGKVYGFCGATQIDDNPIICDVHNIPCDIKSMTFKEYIVLTHSSTDPEFFKQMCDLKDNDIIEYNIKMTKFRSYYNAEMQAMRERAEKSKPKCPTCGSTNINKISGLDRATSVSLLGIFSKKINKSFQCKDCKFTW